MESPDAVDARNFVSTLAMIRDLRPEMPEASARRAADRVARAKANLADAIAAEGFSLHAAPAVPARAAAPATPAPAPLAASAPVVRRQDLAAVAAPAPLTAEDVKRLELAGRIMGAESEREKIAIIQNAESQRVADEARALQARDPKRFPTFYAAVEHLTRRSA